MPDFTHAKTGGDGEARSFEEAARARVARPFGPSDARTRSRRTRRTRRKLTVRLGLDDFHRFKAHAEESGRTYQDIIAAATLTHLKDVASPAKPAPAPGALARVLGLFRHRG
jgi:hypothetical protein